MATSNRLLPLIACAAVLMLVFVTLRTCSNDTDDEVVMDAVPQAPVPDADTPADTIKTLTANVSAMTAEVEALRQNNTRLHTENQQLLDSRVQIEENVMTRVKRELLSREHEKGARERADSSVLSSLTQRVDALSQSLSHANSSDRGTDIPVGLGYEDDGAGTNGGAGLVWIPPLDANNNDPSDTNTNALLYPALPSPDGGPGSAPEHTGHIIRELDTLQPVYTVPRNATLIGSTLMTALIGRVPVHGQVRDPMPFKVITGSENLAANGLTVPGVQGMVWSGTAIGDWTLSCVTGRLDSVTFVFDDGTLRTISNDDRNGPSGGANQSLGWISDQQGIPCISGARKTNAPAYLAQRMGAMAVQAAADAAGAGETTSVTRDTGAQTHNVTGDTGTYVLGKTIAGTSEELAKWLAERQSQSFDAVFVPAGTGIAIHLERELPIDLDLTGRKLNHAKSINPYYRTRLD